MNMVPTTNLYSSLPSLISETFKWASLVSLVFGWTEAIHRPLPECSRRACTLMDVVFTLFNMGSSAIAIRQGSYMLRERHKVTDVCPNIARSAAANFASAVVLVTLSCVSAWRSKHGQSPSAYVWCVLGLLGTSAVIDAVATAQLLWEPQTLTVSDYSYSPTVVLVNVLAVFFLLGSFLCAGLRDRILFKRTQPQCKQRDSEDSTSPFGAVVCWPLRSHLINIVVRKNVAIENAPPLQYRARSAPLQRQLRRRLINRWRGMMLGAFISNVAAVVWIDIMWTSLVSLTYFGCVIIKVPILEALIEARDDWDRATTAVLFAAASIADLLICCYQMHVALRMCVRVRSMLQGALFVKMTRLSPLALARNPSGYVVSLLGVDCIQISSTLLQIPQPLAGLVCMPFVLYLLGNRAGLVPALGCTVWLLLVMLLPLPVSVLQNALWIRVTRFRDERLRRTADLLSSVRVVKLYAWEDAYMGAVNRVRNSELAALLRANVLDGLVDSLYSSTSTLLTIILFGLYAAVDPARGLTPAMSFSCLYLLSLTDMITNVLATTLRMRSLVALGLRRICKFCTEEEEEEPARDFKEPIIQKGEVSLSGCNFSWASPEASSSHAPGEPALRDLTFRVAPGSLIGVVGFVGSGKSSLLAAILGDMHRTSGSLRTSGSIAYASQVACIFNMTVRDNITFGKRFEPVLYSKVIRACELLNDLNSFPAGDLTEVGEKGETLSGGQKQRISLARAVYSGSSIYLLDDPLSALDPTVAARVFKHVIGKNGLLRNTTRILVCNQGMLLKHMDGLLLMHDRTATPFTTLADLLAHKAAPQTARIAGGKQAHARLLATDGRDAADISDQDEARGRLTVDEAVLSSKSSLEVTRAIGRLAGAYGPVSLLCFVASAGAVALQQLYIKRWTDAMGKGGDSSNWIGGLVGVCLSDVAFRTVGGLLLAGSALRVSGRMHRGMLEHVMGSPVSFFDETPRGRILTRFSVDMDAVDTRLFLGTKQCLQNALITLAKLAVVGTQTPPVIVIGALAAAVVVCATIPIMMVSLCLSLFIVLQTTVAFERNLEYMELPAEVDVERCAADDGNADDALLAVASAEGAWPTAGLVEFEKYSASYRPGILPDVLKGVTFVVNPQEKVGVVGRTGAGKSSLVLALLRVLRASQGRILIDGVDISTVSLRRLRSAVTVIPQDPSLMRGSLRDNLDPTGQHSDDQLWKALRQAHLAHLVAGRPQGLLLETGDGGGNFSVGQRQLVCLARALLRGPKILILDEATSQMDGDTDRLIQATLREAFSHCTVMAIAHRIHTVLDYDKILVMAEGSVLEYGPVMELIHNPSSAFYAMAKSAGALPLEQKTRDSFSFTQL
ncbi:multidrug resistance protein mrp-7-like isoform X4 [Haemaphysalis longicornis]